MKQLNHICFTSHGEVMFRDAQDVGMMLNFIALSSWEYGVDVLADAEMSTHVHLITVAGKYKALSKAGRPRTEVSQIPADKTFVDRGMASDFVSSIRKRYTSYFSAKYHRPKGIRLGEKGFFYSEVSGNCHMQTAMSYVLRNPWHHGVSSSPFEYPFSAANDIFPLILGRLERPRKDNPKVMTVRKRSNGSWTKTSACDVNVLPVSGIWCPPDCELITSRQEIAHWLPRFSEWPDEWVMSKDHVFLRPCFEDLKQTERLYVTPSAYEYAMFRKTDARMIEEQNADANGKPPVTLADIEPGADQKQMERFTANEKAAVFRSLTTDFDICRVIDNDILPEFACQSVYELKENQLRGIVGILEKELHFSAHQVGRCLPFLLFS